MRLVNYIKHKIMAFVDIFKDENDIDEKNVVGFISFAVMVLTMLVDIVSGFFGHNLDVQEFVYNSFLIVTLGSFGISEAGKIFSVHKK
ncbi:MAG: hypothetical protein CMC82_03445 [Flavobacteriaceae bacterium]|nr:hypothetical protein [Flavobacteriaceae bacterium]|tara:strand:- start:3213 stop:3476 length:264 start_codon:yes stop_codon:yes gene_type:complete